LFQLTKKIPSAVTMISG